MKSLLALILAAVAAAAHAGVVEEVIDLPVTVTNMYNLTVTHTIKVTIFRDDARPRSPFLVLNHGRATTAEANARMGRVRYADNSRYFVEKGFAVFVPTRVGYGVSGGEDMEYAGTCQMRNYPPAFEAAARQSVALIEHARKLPYVDPGRGLVVGQSYGGATAIALAAKGLPGVVATVNFAGGGGGNPQTMPENPCRADLLLELFAGYGEKARVPTLWLYSENDRYWGMARPKAWFAAFLAKGGAGEFVALPASGDDGHSIFTRNPAAWKPPFEDFLRKHGF